MSSVFPAIEVLSFTRGNGIDTRISVRAASTGIVNLGADLVGATIDGVTLAANDRLLIKNQADAAQVVQVTTIADVAGSLNNKYFLISSPTVDFYVWLDVGGAGTDPAIPSRTAIPVAVATNASANTIATAIAAAVDPLAAFLAPPPGANVITITNTAIGVALAPTAGNSGFAVATTTAGAAALDNGIWTIASGAMQSYRADDLIAGDDAAFVFCDCEAGTANIRSSWSQVSRPGIVGSNTLNWVQRGLFNYSAGQMFYATSANTIGTLGGPLSTNRILVTDGSGVPSFGTALPAGTTASTPSGSSDVANKAYVDSLASGFDPKESVRVRTLTDIAGTYNAAGGAGATGAFTNVDLTSTTLFDLSAGPIPVLTVGSRILIMNQTDPKQNGIYEVTTAGVAGALQRAADQNGTPIAEVSSGNFTFVETGALYGSTGWVLQGDGTITLNTDNLNWVQFSSPGSWNGLNGITISGANISTDLFLNGGIVYNGSSPNGQLQVDLGASAITGTVSSSHGGTGLTTYALGDLLIGTGSGLTTKNSALRRVLTTDNAGAGVVDWRNDVHLENIRGNDTNQPKLVQFTTNNSTTPNFIGISNAVPSSPPIVSALGGDTNVGLRLASKGTGAIEIVGATNSGEIRLYNQAQTQYAGIKAAAMASNITWTWPATDGTSGQVMRTDGSGILSFVNPSSTIRQVIPIAINQASATSTTLTAIGYFDWDFAEFGSTPAKLFYSCTIGNRDLTVEVFNETTGLSIQTNTQTTVAQGFFKFSFASPTNNARLSVRISKSANQGVNPNVFGVALILNPLS